MIRMDGILLRLGPTPRILPSVAGNTSCPGLRSAASISSSRLILLGPAADIVEDSEYFESRLPKKRPQTRDGRGVQWLAPGHGDIVVLLERRSWNCRFCRVTARSDNSPQILRCGRDRERVVRRFQRNRLLSFTGKQCRQ